MTELINGRTPEEIKYALGCGADAECDNCAYCSRDFETMVHGFCCNKVTKDALALIERLEAKVPKWISVEERLPDNDAKYLVYMPDYGLHEVAEYYGDGEWLDVDFTNLTRHVSHWMPLPEPPEVSE